MNGISLYFKLIRISVASQMQYRASFVIMSMGMALVTVIEFGGIWVLFDRFGSLQQWTLAEVGLFYGIIHCSFALSEALGRGFDIFHRYVQRGDFDRLLLRPRSTVLQVLGQELQLMRFGRLAQAMAILIWASWTVGVQWTVLKFAVLLFAIAGGVLLFIGIMIVQATVSFWTIQGLEFMNSFTHGGTYMAQHPLSIFDGWLRNFFLFVIPLGCVNYFPVLFITGKQDIFGTTPLFQALAPLAGAVFLLVSLYVWRFGLSRYQSTGS